jgi:hypothetical protein
MHPWLLRLVTAGTDSRSLCLGQSAAGRDLEDIKFGPGVVDLIG